MFPDNPSLIQEGPLPQSTNLWSKPPTPLVLIHDGGGTVFSYYCLGELDRPVHGISNPHYDSGEPFPGGIPEMARLYVKYIKSVVPRGNLLIGGWSLGGLLSLEVASQLAHEENKVINLLGVIMIDSVCPLSWRSNDAQRGILSVVKTGVAWGPHTKEETKQKVTRCFAESGRMVGEWELPVWETAQAQVHQSPFGEEGETGRETIKPPPPVILLRATDLVPVPDAKEGAAVSRVDVCRGDKHLGWDVYRPDLITRVVDIPGHHFNIFSDMDNLDVATEEIRKACADLEGMHVRRFFAWGDSPR